MDVNTPAGTTPDLLRALARNVTAWLVTLGMALLIGFVLTTFLPFTLFEGTTIAALVALVNKF